MKLRNILLASVALCVPARAGALDSVVDSLDNVPDALHSEYVEQGGKYVLQVNGMRPAADYDRVNNALTKERNDHTALKGRITSHFGDRKFEEVVADLDKIEEYKQAADGKLDEAAINNIVEGRLRTRLAPVERERDQLRNDNAEKDKTIAGFQGKERTRSVRDAVREAATKAKVRPEAIDDALLLGDNLFEIREDDGKVVVREGTGFTQGIEPSVLFSDLQTKKPHWFGESAGGGASGNRDGRGGSSNPFTHANWNVTEQGRLMDSNPDKADQMAKAAGHNDAATAVRPAAPAK